MYSILNWMSSAKEQEAITVSDNVGGDMIVELGAKDIQIEGSEDILFHIDHMDRQFLLMPTVSNYILICYRSN